jgi:hypothetical protein
MIAVRDWDSKNWRIISYAEWKAAEDKTPKVSAFAETRDTPPSGFASLEHWVIWINS